MASTSTGSSASLTPLDPGRLGLHLIPEQLQFLPDPLGGVLGQQGQVGGPIHQATAQTGTKTVDGSLKQELRRAHGCPASGVDFGRSGLGKRGGGGAAAGEETGEGAGEEEARGESADLVSSGRVGSP